MRRCFVILLIALLPFQSAWAAMASYCGHGAGQPVQHLGHHDHPDMGAAAGHAHGGDASAGDFSPASDFECDHAHAGCAVLPMQNTALTPRAAASHPAALVEQALRTLVHAPPERPQWLRLA